mgnify:CR=1 FL=1
MTVNTEVLLDKLYNLRGSDSTILKEMDRQKAKAEETRERTTEEKAKLQKDIESLKKLSEELDEQGEKFKEVLQGIHREDYETVLERLRIDFDPKSLLEKLDKNLPRTIDNVKRDTKKAEDELVKVEDEMNTAITTIEELGIRRDTALANQEKLNESIELALTGHINTTRDSITSLLEEFGFNEVEQREAAKILMFPEDALFAYDAKVKAKDKAGKSISEVIQEAKTMSPSVPEYSEPEEEQPVIEEPAIPEEDEPRKEDLVIETLRDCGIDYLDFTSDEIDELICNFDEETVRHNIAFIESNGLSADIFVHYIKMMYDKDLKRKFDLLLGVGKEPMDIYLNPGVLVKYSLEQLERVISVIRANGMDPKEIPLMAY